jgi:hypothetical protein
LATFKHPASLNPLQQFRQACSILRHTSRARNPAWYQEALELPFQLHIRTDGSGFTAFYHDRRQNQWSAGPEITHKILGDADKIAALASGILDNARTRGASSLGVILHLADEFATTELQPELDNPASLPELRDTAVRDPASILADSSINADESSWRVIPYPASGSEAIATTVTLSRQHAALLGTLREAGEKENFPIITQALSAPLVALMGLPVCLVPTPGRPFVAILHYAWFSVLAFFNEHSDLCLLRTLQHRGMRRTPDFRSALSTTSASLEFLDPDLFIFPLCEDPDNQIEGSLRLAFSTSRVETIRLPDQADIPVWAPEPRISSQPADGEHKIESHTFAILRDDKWALQDFLPTPREIVEIYPSRQEMRLLRLLRLSRVAVFAVMVLILAYLLLGVVEMIRRPEWAFNPAEAQGTKVRLTKLTNERKAAEHWNNLLDDRSKAWVVMESLSRMFPENGGMLVKNFNHSSKPETAPGQAKVGFIKEWKISGYARDEALDTLNTLNTREGINAHFAEIARATGVSAFDPHTGNRSISVNVRTQENSGFKPIPPEEAMPSDESTYPFTFDLTITQRFEATDPLALAVPKAP